MFPYSLSFPHFFFNSEGRNSFSSSQSSVDGVLLCSDLQKQIFIVISVTVWNDLRNSEIHSRKFITSIVINSFMYFLKNSSAILTFKILYQKWSIGNNVDVILGGKKTNISFFKNFQCF